MFLSSDKLWDAGPAGGKVTNAIYSNYFYHSIIEAEVIITSCSVKEVFTGDLHYSLSHDPTIILWNSIWVTSTPGNTQLVPPKELGESSFMSTYKQN